MLTHHCLAHVHWWCFIPSHSSSIILTLHRADGGVGNSSSLSYTPSSAHVISSHSSILSISQSWLPSCIQNYQHQTPDGFRLLITTLSFPFSLHMPLITTFSSGLWLCWSLITTFLLVQWVGRQFGRKIFWGNNYVIQALELHGC